MWSSCLAEQEAVCVAWSPLPTVNLCSTPQTDVYDKFDIRDLALGDFQEIRESSRFIGSMIYESTSLVNMSREILTD